MLISVISSFGFALLSFYLSKNKKHALIALILCFSAIILGEFSVKREAVDKVSWSLGLDMLLLDLFLMVLIFVPIELASPKNKNQTKFHPE